MSLKVIDASKQVEYIPINNEKVPYSFDIKLGDRTFTFCVKYNEQGRFYTADLYVTATGEILCYGDPIRYGRQLFGSVEDERYPLPAIVPYCLAGEAQEVTKENLGVTVQLYLHERRSEDNVSVLD